MREKILGIKNPAKKQKFINKLREAGKWAKFSHSTVSELKDFKNHHPLLSLAKLGSKTIEGFSEAYLSSARAISSWESIDGLNFFTPTIVNLGSSKKIKSDDFQFLEIDGYNVLVEFGSIMVWQGTDKQEVKNSVARKIIEEKGPRVKIVKANKSKSEYLIVPADPFDAIESETGNKIYRRVQKYLNRGIRRSICLYGSPGTGKTTIASYLAEMVGGVHLYIDAADLSPRAQGLDFGFDLLKPSVVIINDLDRAPYLGRVLTLLEKISKRSKLVVTTMNNIDVVPKAVLRPGRFDDMIRINHCDKGVIEKILQPLPEQYSRRASEWPVAFIVELRKRFDTFGLEMIEEEFEDLQWRVKENEREGKKDEKE